MCVFPFSYFLLSHDLKIVNLDVCKIFFLFNVRFITFSYLILFYYFSHAPCHYYESRFRLFFINCGYLISFDVLFNYIL